MARNLKRNVSQVLYSFPILVVSFSLYIYIYFAFSPPFLLAIVLSLPLLLLLRNLADTKVSQDKCMASSKCSDQGPAIRFPFQLKDRHPHHCGCPLFELSCTEKNQTMLELPHSVKFLVKNINYKSQQILVHDPDYCLPRQLGNLDLAVTPFQFSEELEDLTFFNCSSVNGQTSGVHVPCLDVPGYQVWMVFSSDVIFSQLLPCGNKMYASSLPWDEDGIIKNYFHLNWTTPSHCKGKGKIHFSCS